MWDRQPTSYTAATYQHFMWICHLAATFLQRATSATLVEFFTSFKCTNKVLMEHVWYLQGTNGTYLVPARYQWNIYGTCRVPMEHVWYLQGTNGTCKVPMVQPQSGTLVAARWQIHLKYWQVAPKWIVGCQFHKYLQIYHLSWKFHTAGTLQRLKVAYKWQQGDILTENIVKLHQSG